MCVMIQLLFLVSLIAIDYGASMKLSPRVVGGRPANPGEIPYQVSLQEITNERHFCGGVIINEYYVVTGAHCIYRRDISDISVNAGTIDLQKPNSVHLIESAYIHKKYNPQQFPDRYGYDIALLKLQTPFVFSSLISPANLPEQDEVIETGSPALISGYGMITTDGKRTKQLHIVDNIIANQTYCRDVYDKLIHIEIRDSQICSIHPTVEKGACMGDSGGPLTVNGQLIGLISFTYDCGSTEYPTVYTRIPSFIDWIYEHTRINEINTEKRDWMLQLFRW